ncbi:MAG: hypothetical protein IKK03_07070 [Lachnospiraceae bacterium]|nr:hypothetical protein [Lachnospiraceae bacterium]
MNANKNYKANREYKSTVFSKLFGEDKENALSLYNAVNGSNYTNADEFHGKYQCRYEPGAFA